MATRKCHDGPCGPCSLCYTYSRKYIHPGNLEGEQFTFLCEIESRVINMTECICYSCSKQIKRNINKQNFTPRWRSKSMTKSRCSIEGCTNDTIKNTHLASCEEIEQVLDQTVTSFTVTDTTSVALCQ